MCPSCAKGNCRIRAGRRRCSSASAALAFLRTAMCYRVNRTRLGTSVTLQTGVGQVDTITSQISAQIQREQMGEPAREWPKFRTIDSARSRGSAGNNRRAGLVLWKRAQLTENGMRSVAERYECLHI